MTREYGPPDSKKILTIIAETINRSDGLEIAKGEVPGQRSEFKFGHQAAISSAEIAIWDLAAAYAYLSSARVMSVGSSDANDMSTGSGARTVKVWGLDSDYNEISETVTLASTAAASTTQEYLRVFRAKVITAGSGGKNAGIIYVGASTMTGGVPADKYAAIGTSENETLMALWTVPAGKTAYLQKISGNAGVATADIGATIRLKVRELGEVFQTKEKFNSIRAMVSLERATPKAIPEKSDIEMTAERVGSTDVDVAATFELILVDN